jgi:hypothetical protein
MNRRIKREVKRYTHYTVPSEVKVGRGLEMTLGIDMILYSRDQGRWHDYHSSITDVKSCQI